MWIGYTFLTWLEFFSSGRASRFQFSGPEKFFLPFWADFFSSFQGQNSFSKKGNPIPKYQIVRRLVDIPGE